MATKRDMEEDVAPLLKGLKPDGWLGFCALLAAAVPIWVVMAMRMAWQYVMGKRVPAKDRGSLQLPAPFPGLTEEMVDVGNGVRLLAVSPGRRRDKPLMLFVRGFPECWYSWRHQMAAFQDSFDVVAMDMRGYNKSDKPQGITSYTLDKTMADIPAMVKGLGHTSCTLVAHDWGGIIAWLAAAAYPSVVQRLVVMAAPHLGLGDVNMKRLELSTLQQVLKSWYILWFQAPILPELWMLNNDCAFIGKSLTDSFMGVRTPGAIRDVDIEWLKQAAQRPGAMTCALHYYRALMLNKTLAPSPEVWAAMRRRVRTPALVLWGGKDGALGTALMDNIEQVAPAAEMHVLPDCSHWVQQDQPEEVNRLMRAFLDKQR